MGGTIRRQLVLSVPTISPPSKSFQIVRWFPPPMAAKCNLANGVNWQWPQWWPAPQTGTCMTSLGPEWGPHLLSPRSPPTTNRCLGHKCPTKENRCPTSKEFHHSTHMVLRPPTTTANSTTTNRPPRGTPGLCGSLRPLTSLVCHSKIQENIPGLFSKITFVIFLKFSCDCPVTMCPMDTVHQK